MALCSSTGVENKVKVFDNSNQPRSNICKTITICGTWWYIEYLTIEHPSDEIT